MSVFSETCSLSLTQATTDVVFVSQFISFQLLSHVRFFATPWTAARQASLSITKSQSLFKLMSMKSAMTANHLILSLFLSLHFTFSTNFI